MLECSVFQRERASVIPTQSSTSPSLSPCLPLCVLAYVLLLSFLSGYIEAVVIPAGARRIKVVEDKPSHSFLGNDERQFANSQFAAPQHKHCYPHMWSRYFLISAQIIFGWHTLKFARKAKWRLFTVIEIILFLSVVVWMTHFWNSFKSTKINFAYMWLQYLSRTGMENKLCWTSSH